ncbi:hypothetical protein LTR53_019436, partial [Teratosphaeriaceae sp. CCFEE 6253]
GGHHQERRLCGPGRRGSHLGGRAGLGTAHKAEEAAGPERRRGESPLGHWLGHMDPARRTDLCGRRCARARRPRLDGAPYRRDLGRRSVGGEPGWREAACQGPRERVGGVAQLAHRVRLAAGEPGPVPQHCRHAGGCHAGFAARVRAD